MQLVDLPVQNIHELLELALHVALLLSAVVDVQLQPAYPALQLLVLRFSSLQTHNKQIVNRTSILYSLGIFLSLSAVISCE